MTQRYLRSVNIAHDYTQSASELDGYIATPLVLQSLSRIARGVNDSSQGRAYSIIGPYGTGKSAFGLFLAHWFGSTIEQRQTLLKTHASNVGVEIDIGTAKLLPIVVQSKASTLRQGILEGISISVEKTITSTRVKKQFGSIFDSVHDAEVTAEQVADLLYRANELLKTHTQYEGMLILIDELGQSLSQIHRSGDTRDLFVLQTIAEVAARSRNTPIVVVTILHQTFERYSTTGSVAQQTEWAKVQGRYIDLVFQEPVAQMLRFTAKVLGERLKPSDWVRTSRRLSDESISLDVKPPEIPADEWHSLVYNTFPLHPVVLVALPYLFRSVAQNERSLFAFLTSHEPGGLVEREVHLGDKELYRVADLYAYIENTLGPGLFGRAKGRPWVEMSELIQRTVDLSSLQQSLILTIGTLSAINEERLLKPTKKIIAFAMEDCSDSAVLGEQLAALERQRVILYSKFRDRWRLAEATDVNVDERVQLLRNDLSLQDDTVELLHQYAVMEPIVAYRHAYRTGTVRSFALRFVDAQKLTVTEPDAAGTADGEIWYVVVPNDEVRQQVLKKLRSDVILVFPERTTQMRDVLLDVAAHRKLLLDKEINSDRVAKRELELRLSEAEYALRQQTDYSYGHQHGMWYVSGLQVDVDDARDLDEALSSFLDRKFFAAPLYRNELIVRRKISGTVARARRLLIEMLLNQSSERLFIGDTYPPERAIYESFFIAGGLHRKNDEGLWEFSFPAKNDDHLRLYPMFEAIEAFLTETVAKRRPLTDLYALLRSSPFGLREPMLPLVFVTSYLARSGEIALYEHDTYVAAPDISVFERVIAKPAYFSIKLTPSSELRTALFERIARAFAPNALAKTGSVALLDAVRPMLKFAAQLPAYVKNTKTLSQSTRDILDALLNAKAPDELLYNQLPAALGLPEVDSVSTLPETYVESFAIKLRKTLEELQNAYTMLQSECIRELAQALAAQSADSELLRVELVERMHIVLDQSADPQLRTLAVRLINASTSGWIEPVAAVLGKKPMPAWTDADVAVYKQAAIDIGRRLRLFEQIATAQESKLLGATRRRIGITDSAGERSVVVRVSDDENIIRIRDQIRALTKQNGLQRADVLNVLALLLEEVLPLEGEG